MWALRSRPDVAAVRSRLWRAITAALEARRPLLPAPDIPGWPGVPDYEQPDIAPPDSTITTRFGAPPAPVAVAIKRHFPAHVWGQAAEIAYHESGWRPTAVNDTRHYAGGQCGVYYHHPVWGAASTEYSVGLFQINVCAHGGTADRWYDIDTNVAFAAALWRRRGEKWTDWWLSAGKAGAPR